ncbi:carbamoyl-phosphate synthase large subunit [Glutamicibacter protophormiae]|uniref:Carbamoyl phosphate synthase large chain n=1 Tax=Glutamicibacter protophormiae TaxID=37930 RepID=A0ABS4XT55_GLUPR|nr:carbamoyl-phosphate synthase large subunit [Glutamicibacter protophormiae]MBP2399693.1 carbamoyl-phosphate synthase large subunit [Glutamicibacter protophormiae]WPR66420.1 carbamoyl-phosphate synthase large subunit [Glutamicibacter protophormiae]WPR69916.1 carbamoyl-phosphate synthase large subunit [Glutamicibacter protophormiae]GGL88399.1 carbamoyl-phosphate synthase large chain [Glutamicibacter protophormiae]
MPKRTDLNSVLVIGSGPIVIGQAAEFDYSGTQALRVLKEEGLRVILVNSNPATIMTDPEFADATYVEPITPEVVEKIIAKERPDAILPTLGGQTALNTAIALDKSGALEKYNVELIGANIEAIELGEDREKFKGVVERCGAESAKSVIVHTLDEAFAAVEELNYPVVVRPSFTMGGLGSGMAYNAEDLTRIAGAGLQYSPTTEVLLEESILGWKEYELEMMRDKNDNVVVVCSIENFDPVGVHTGDSITVAPAMTLTDREYQNLRDISIAVIREVGVDTGGCNIQFAIEPDTGRVVVIEMNPRVSRSSALASKATGFAIAKIATKLSLGYTLDEIPNDITQKTPASFEPALDYVVVKVPRFAFEKFPAADATLTTTMKSVGEAMALGRNFTEALQKALRSLEQKGSELSFEPIPADELDSVMKHIEKGSTERMSLVQRALLSGKSIEELFEATGIDPWYLDQLALINETAAMIAANKDLGEDVLREAKRHGFSDAQIAKLSGKSEAVVRGVRHALGVRPVYKTVDTCAAEFEAFTPYMYSSYDEESELVAHEKKSVIILGSGPNRIGQGIEFDYSCVHAVMALRAEGYETVMVNCNPETVSTDYDISDRLYFEPLTLEDVLEIIHAEEETGGVLGVFVQLGGQTPLKLAAQLKAAGVTILGTSPEAIDLAEHRGAFQRVLDSAGLIAPKNGTAVSFPEAKAIADSIGYPVLVRPSYVLGGRGMEIVYDEASLERYIANATEITVDHPVLVDRFLEDAIEIDVDALFDGTDLYVGGIMEHIEEAGIHSGDSACTLPPITLGPDVRARVKEATRAIAEGVGVRGLINIQFALASDILYVIEANPRASRTVPFTSKATGVQLAKVAALIGVGRTLSELRGSYLPAEGDGANLPDSAPIAVKEAVMPFARFRTPEGKVVDSLLGPEMRSTGEVMGIDKYFDTAFAKSQAAANNPLPTSGKVFVSVTNRDKRSIVLPVKHLADRGFEIISTGGTAEVLRRNGIPTQVVGKLHEGGESIVDLIHAGEIGLILNTPSGSDARGDGYEIRAAATSVGTPVITTVAEFGAAVQAIDALREYAWDVTSLQEHEAALEAARNA